MGFNIFALVSKTADAQAVANEINERYSGTLFDWCDLFRGADTKNVMTPAEAIALEDEAGPFMVYQANGQMLPCFNRDFTVPRQAWEPVVKEHDGLVVFIKARGMPGEGDEEE